MTYLTLAVLLSVFIGLMFGGVVAFIATNEWYDPRVGLWGKRPQAKVDTTTVRYDVTGLTVRYDVNGLLSCDTTFRV